MHIQSKYILQQSHIVFKVHYHYHFNIKYEIHVQWKYLFILVKLNENVNLYYGTDYNPFSSTDTTHVNI